MKKKLKLLLTNKLLVMTDTTITINGIDEKTISFELNLFIKHVLRHKIYQQEQLILILYPKKKW
jgi:hypothetical protein